MYMYFRLPLSIFEYDKRDSLPSLCLSGVSTCSCCFLIGVLKVSHVKRRYSTLSPAHALMGYTCFPRAADLFSRLFNIERARANSAASMEGAGPLVYGSGTEAREALSPSSSRAAAEGLGLALKGLPDAQQLRIIRSSDKDSSKVIPSSLIIEACSHTYPHAHARTPRICLVLPTDSQYKVGMKVVAQWGDNAGADDPWLPATVSHLHRDGTVDLVSRVASYTCARYIRHGVVDGPPTIFGVTHLTYHLWLKIIINFNA